MSHPWLTCYSSTLRHEAGRVANDRKIHGVGGGGRGEAWNQQSPSTVGGKENAHDRGLQQATAVKKIACFF